MLRLLLPTVAVFAVLCPGSSFARGDDAGTLYEDSVRPLLREKCSACHGALQQEAGLRLDAGTLILAGGDSGPVVQPEDVDASRILQRVTHADVDLRMPPSDAGTPLNDSEVRVLREWIRNGAPVPEHEPIPAGPDEHWAWQPLASPLPEFDASKDSPHPIDALVQAHWRREGLQPVGRADADTLTRRLYLDLIGLPPNPEDLAELRNAADDSVWAYVVDRLLDRPAHGERWARHWMDVWRYSDWDGYRDEVRGSQRHIWHWRDWIVESLNADKGYDQMIREMLAADELYPEDMDRLRATGYLVRSFHNSNRDIWLDAVVEHTSKAFLALTVDCARCHDHKYDPIAQEEYYAFRAIFEPYHVRTERLPGQPDLKQGGLPRAFDKSPEAPTYLYVGGNEKLKDEDHPLTPALPDILPVEYRPQPTSLPPVAVFPALRDYIREEDLAAARKALTAAEQQLAAVRSAESDNDATPTPTAVADGGTVAEPDELPAMERQLAEQRVTAARTELTALEARWNADVAKYADTARETAEPSELNRQAALAERTAAQERARFTVLEKQYALATLDEPDAEQRRKSTAKLQKELSAAKSELAKATEALETPGDDYTPVGTAWPRTTTGRRTGLAAALTAPDNPLVARVAVNYLWMHHFGEPIVANVFDFGLRTPEPELRDVLDFLAVQLIRNGWRMKPLHRLILTSELWRQRSSGASPQMASNAARDPENRWFWRARVRRLEAEVIRDSVLHLSGSLDRTQGGPEIPHDQGETSCRRSLYFQHAYEKQMTMMVTFDAAGPQECYRRSSSIVPQQALALSNSRLVLREAAVLADAIGSAEDGVSDEAFVRSAVERILARPCTDEELAACVEFLSRQTALLQQPAQLTRFDPSAEADAAAPRQRARRNLVHVLFNHNDFITVR